MTHQTRKAPRKTTERQILIFTLCIFLIGALIGGGIVAAAKAISGNKAETREPYSTKSGKTLTGSAPYEYLSALSFEPLECDLPVELQEYTYYLCEAYYIDFEFVMALMYVESSFDANAVSNTNDYGLLQINKCNHKQLQENLGVTDFLEPYQNIRAGLYILRALFEKYDEPALVLMAYNMGEYGASVLWDNGVYETTHSLKVLAQAENYAAQRGLQQ